MVHERRLYQRLTPSSPQLILLDESKYSLLFDLSEGGVAIEGFASQDRKKPVSLEFDMPEGSGCIHAQAEVIWTSDSGYRTGFRFLDLPDSSRKRLSDWVSAAAASRVTAIDEQLAKPEFAIVPEDFRENFREEEVKEFRPEPARPAAAAARQPEFQPHLSESFAEHHEDFESDGSAIHVAPVFIAGVVMSAIAFLLGYYWRAGKPRYPSKPIVSAAQVSQPSAGNLNASNPQIYPQAVIPPMLPLESSGFILQVAAMAKEENADALSNELRKKNFSSFVYHRSSDSFYRVAVGPYTQQSAANRIKADLDQEGYNSILKPWTPE